jgi:cytochrome P450
MVQHAPIPFPLPASPSIYHPTPELAELQKNRPVVQLAMPDGSTAWLVTRYADVRQVMTDPRFSRAAAAGVASTGLGELAKDSILGMDPPEHTRLRRLVARAFTARRVADMRQPVVKLVDELLTKLAAQPRPVDLVENFSLPLPVQVICELLGVPPEDRHTFHAWSDTLMGDWDRDPSEMAAALTGINGYLAGLIAAKRAEPADDLMTALIAARDEHDRLSEKELVTLCMSVLIAGHETTANQINMCLLTLLRYPEELARLHADPEAIPAAVEELMRFVQLGEGGAGMPRVTTEDVQLSGVTIPAGSAVMASLAAANRDPELFPEPDRLDVTRAQVQHLAFGAGVHHCLGAQLARMELQEGLRGLLGRFPTLRLAVPESDLRFKKGMVLRSLESLLVTW